MRVYEQAKRKSRDKEREWDRKPPLGGIVRWVPGGPRPPAAANRPDLPGPAMMTGNGARVSQAAGDEVRSDSDPCPVGRRGHALRLCGGVGRRSAGVDHAAWAPRAAIDPAVGMVGGRRGTRGWRPLSDLAEVGQDIADPFGFIHPRHDLHGPPPAGTTQGVRFVHLADQARLAAFRQASSSVSRVPEQGGWRM